MTLLFADHCCLGDEKKYGAFVLYFSCVILMVAAGFEGDVNSGVSVFVLPDYEPYVANDVNLRMVQSLKPVDSSVALMMRA